MLHTTLNLGILAHVDAGKTTLTERLLYAAGVIDELGSVDRGTTQTDSLALERQRGITIKAAVASFAIDDVTVNLIDTPGHPDFIAEVERVLSVLDGAVLVISAVEGVQPQTRILMRALQRLRIPTLIFVNKIDRAGAGDERVLRAISDRLGAVVVPMGTVDEIGTRAASFHPSTDRYAEVLAERNQRIMAAYVANETAVPQLAEELAVQTKRAHIHPVFFGSAITGAGVEDLLAELPRLLPTAEGDPAGEVSGTVFKIERGASGEKVAYVRMFSGTIRTRDALQFGREQSKVTSIAVFERGPAVQRPSASAGDVAKVWGLHDIKIGDRLGDRGAESLPQQFPPPTLESVVVARNQADRERLRGALAQLAEQDPLINVRSEDEISVSLYGEVQKEVIEATLANEFGLDVTFHETTPLYIERPTGSGEALEILYGKTKTNVTGKSSPFSTNPFPATLGLRVDAAPPDSGIAFRLEIDVRLVPMYIYKTVGTFSEHMEEYVLDSLQRGLSGWQVIDCTVTLTDCGYRAPGTTAGDFRKLTPLVLRRALEQSGTVVCEPFTRVTLELPTDTIGAVLPVLSRLGAAIEAQSADTESASIETLLPATRVQNLQRQLPGLTGGEGVLDSTFAGYRPVNGEQPARGQP